METIKTERIVSVGFTKNKREPDYSMIARCLNHLSLEGYTVRQRNFVSLSVDPTDSAIAKFWVED